MKNDAPRIAALLTFLQQQGLLAESDTIDDITPVTYTDNTYDAAGAEWGVFTDDEAEEGAREYTIDSLWTFNPEFLEHYCPEGVDADILRLLQEHDEDANPALLKLVGDNIDRLINDAIASDGRGYFLSPYDGEEHEAGQFYIYRTN